MMSELLIRFDLKPAGGNYRCMWTLIKRLELDTSHFHGQGWNKGKKLPPKRPLTDYLSNKFPIKSYALKGKLIRENILEHKCSQCNRKTWNNKPIPLELDHIDGNHDNNNLDNLRLLCPNCHAQTPTYRRMKSSLKKE